MNAWMDGRIKKLYYAYVTLLTQSAVKLLVKKRKLYKIIMELILKLDIMIIKQLIVSNIC